MSMSFTLHRFTQAWRAFRNPPPRWTVKKAQGFGPIVITPDPVSVDDGRAIVQALREYKRRHGRLDLG